MLLGQIIGRLSFQRKMRWKDGQDKLGERGLYVEDRERICYSIQNKEQAMGLQGPWHWRVPGEGQCGWSSEMREGDVSYRARGVRGQNKHGSQSLRKVFDMYFMRRWNHWRVLSEKRHSNLTCEFLSLASSLENGLKLTRAEIETCEEAIAVVQATKGGAWR